MGDVINFIDKEDLKRTSYTEGVDNGSIGISTLDRRISISRLNDSEFVVTTPNDSQVFNREDLAEFLHIASILLDSDKKWMPSVDLIGCDY